MTNPNDIRTQTNFHGPVSFLGAVFLPDGAIQDRHFDDSALDRLAAAKAVQRHTSRHVQAPGAAVVTQTQLLHLARGDGELLGVTIRPLTAPIGGDKQYTIDLQRAADGSGTWASLLNAPYVVDRTRADDTNLAAALAVDPSYVAGDALRLVVTASGSTGTQGDGLLVQVDLEEQPS